MSERVKGRGGGRGPVIFLGTSEFAVPSLETLVEEGENVGLVVTQPDRPRGRGRRVEPPPVRRAAERLDLAVFQPERLNAPEAVARLRVLTPEFLVVVAYGQLLKAELLGLPSRGTVNLHPSLLPRHRGPSPVAWTILAGDARAGVTTMFLDEGMDTGPILMQESLPLGAELTRGDLEVVLAERGARLLLETLRNVRDGTVSPIPQDPSRSTLSELLTREMRVLDWSRPSAEVRRQVHALSPVPGCLARFSGRLVKVFRVREVDGRGEPGRVLRLSDGGPVVACGRGAVLLAELQPEGKRPMSGAAFCRGGGLEAGIRAEGV